MTLLLERGTKPASLGVKTFGDFFPNLSGRVFLGDYEISTEDFFYMVEYVLTNTDLSKNDLRSIFIKYVKTLRQVEGFNEKGKRLESKEKTLFEFFNKVKKNKIYVKR